MITANQNSTWFVTSDDLPSEIVEAMIATIRMPKESMTESMRNVVRGAIASLSLNMEETNRVLEAIPTLSKMQIDALLDVFRDERGRFASLGEQHPLDVLRLSADRLIGALALAIYRKAEIEDTDEWMGMLRETFTAKVLGHELPSNALSDSDAIPFSVRHLLGITKKSRHTAGRRPAGDAFEF